MSKVLIVSKTRMANDNVCVGGVDFDNKRSVRLMNANGYHESQDECPYDIWDVWDCDYHSSNQRPAPHVEDVNVFNRSKQGVLKSELRSTTELAKLLKQSNIPVFSGSLMNCFDGKLKCTQHGTLFINEESVPNYSTCFWICDRIVKRSDFKGKVRYNYNDGIRNWGYNISYVGLADPPDIIPAGSLIRLSLAHWWSPSDSEDEERCYLQLSGWIKDNITIKDGSQVSLREENLTKVTEYDIKNGIEDEYGMLYSRDSKRLLRYNNDGLEEYKVKDGTKIICDYAFADRGDYASFLKKIILPDSVTHIGKFAFSCFTLQSLNIPQNVTFIDGGFIQADAVNREKPTLICDSSFFKVYDDVLYAQEGESLHSYFGNASTIIVHEGVKSIGAYAFYSCHSMRSIILPNSLLNIGEGAFQYCTSLRNVNIPSKIKRMGDDLFYDCRSLQQITIPDSVITIGKRAFYGCRSLKTLIIPESVRDIGDEAFYGCSSLQTITILGDLRTIGKDLLGKRTKQPVELFGHSMCISLKKIILSKDNMEKFKRILPEDLWDKLYCFENKMIKSGSQDDDLSFQF